MNQGSFSAEVVEGWMDQLEDRPKWLAAFSADPYVGSDPATVEIIGGSYARQESLWVRSDVRALTLDVAVAFRSLVPGTIIAAVGAFDDAFSGALLFRSMILDEDGNPAPLAFPAGGTHLISAGEYVIGLDIPAAP